MPERIKLVSPYKGNLVDLMAAPDAQTGLFAYVAGLPSVQLTRRQACDLELLSTGGFSPLRGFMSRADYTGVVEDMRLADGTLFPIPITLSVKNINEVKLGSDIALRDPRYELLAVMRVEEIYEWDREQFAACVLGTNDPRHPVVAEMQDWGTFNLAGRLIVLKLPEYHDFRELRLTPRQTRMRLEALRRQNVVAFQTRNPMHRGHEAIIQRAIETVGGTLLLHPAVGMSKEGDIDHYTRVRTYKAVADLAFAKSRVQLSLLPLAMRLAGPREAVWHAIIRRNYGANHFVVGRDHASPGNDSNGEPFYGPFDAQKLAKEVSSEVGVNILTFQDFGYSPDEQRYGEFGNEVSGRKIFSLSGTRLREDFLDRGESLPDWLARKEVSEILVESYPPRRRQGACIWFTGLSGSGKSTTAEIVTALLLEQGRRTTLLDGDVVRTHLSKGLGFSKEDRDVNVCRIGFVASEIVRHGGIAVCAAVSPYRQSRNQVRAMLKKEQFLEVFVDTPLDVCEQRDTKGLYASARRGDIRNFTGIDDVYEIPEAPEITLDTVSSTARENALSIIEYLRSRGFLSQNKQVDEFEAKASNGPARIANPSA
jgi:sulfate adenylyltransferase